MPQHATTFDQLSPEWDAFYTDAHAGARAFEFLQRKAIGVDLINSLVPAGARVLEVGCGAGHAALELSRRGYRMTGADISQQMLDTTKKNFADAGLRIDTFHGSADAIPGRYGPFGGVLALGVMDYIDPLTPTLQRLSELLVPGGVLVLSYSNRTSPAEWLEAPLKRTLSALGTGGRRGAVVNALGAAGATRPRSESEVRALYRRTGLETVWTRHLGFGVRFGQHWFPPLPIVRSLDRRLAQSPLKPWGRTFFAVGRKPEVI